MRIVFKFILIYFLLVYQINAKGELMILKLKDGDVKIELFEDSAPKHVERIKN